MPRSGWVLVLVLSILLASCGPAMTPATGPASDSGEVFLIALPRIVVDFDAQGNPSVFDLKLAEIEKLFNVNLGIPPLNKFYIDWMTAANVQHVEMRQTGDGLALFVNGKALPHVGWSDASLQTLGDVSAIVDVRPDTVDLMRRFLPIVRRLGLDLVLRFPRQSGVAEIPLTDPNTTSKLVVQPAKEPASAIIQFEVKYDENGVPGIMGITAADLAAMGITGNLALDKGYIKRLQDHNIQSLELRSKSDGLYLYINGDPLPNIIWDDNYLGNVSSLYVQMNPSSPYVSAAKTLVPLINKADVGVLVHFPIAKGQQAIAVKMH